MDWRVLLFAVTTSIVTGLIFGLMPALRANKSAIEETLRSRSRNIAGKCPKAAERLRRVPDRAGAGFVECRRTSGPHALARRLAQSRNRHAECTGGAGGFISGSSLKPRQARAAWQELMESMRRVPGVQSVALTDIVPMREGENVLGYRATATPPPPNQEAEALASAVTPDYLQVMRLPLLRGRFFNENDRLGSSPVRRDRRKDGASCFSGGRSRWKASLDSGNGRQAPPSGRRRRSCTALGSGGRRTVDRSGPVLLPSRPSPRSAGSIFLVGNFGRGPDQYSSFEHGRRHCNASARRHWRSDAL